MEDQNWLIFFLNQILISAESDQSSRKLNWYLFHQSADIDICLIPIIKFTGFIWFFDELQKKNSDSFRIILFDWAVGLIWLIFIEM